MSEIPDIAELNLRSDLAALIRREDGASLVDDDHSFDIAASIIAAGWRPPLPDWEKELVGPEGDDVKYTEHDVMSAYSKASKRFEERYRKLLSKFEWGWRYYDHNAVTTSTQEEAEAKEQSDRAVEAVFRRVGEWEGAN